MINKNYAMFVETVTERFLKTYGIILIKSRLSFQGEKLYFTNTTIYEVDKDNFIIEELDTINYYDNKLFDLSEVRSYFLNKIVKDILEDFKNKK